MKKRNKICAGILMCGVLATCGTLVGCCNDKPTKPLASTTDVYAFAGATTGMLLSEGFTNTQISSFATETDTQLEDKVKTTISETLDKYMGIFDSVVGGNKPVDVANVESDNETYAHKMTINTKSIDGKTTSCVLYYNETLIDDESHKVEDSDDEEKETKLAGIMVINGQQLVVTGKKEVDPEDNEMEITFEARLDAESENNRVIFKQEREEKNGEVEEEYAFLIYDANGNETKFKFELERNEKGKIEVEYEYTLDGKTISFEIEKETDNSMTIETKDFLGKELEINVTIKKEGEQERYVYSIPALNNLELKGALR